MERTPQPGIALGAITNLVAEPARALPKRLVICQRAGTLVAPAITLQRFVVEVRYTMKTPPVRLLSFVLAMSCAGLLWAQAPTPFGTPSLLPVQDHYADWQSNQVLPSQMVAPVVARPASLGQLPPGYYPRTNAPTPYAAYTQAPGAQVLAVPVPNDPKLPQTQSVVRPRSPLAPVAPAVPHGVAGVYGDLTGDCSDGCSWGQGDAGGCFDPCYVPCFDPRFYASIGGVYFTRNRPRFSQISFDDTDLVGQVLSTDTGLGRWDPGGLAQFGWYLSPYWTMEVTYWGVYDNPVESTVYAANIPGNLNSVLDFSPLNIGATNVNDLFDAAQAHRIRRDYDIQNVELNLLGGRMPWIECGGFRASYLGGFRYLRFSEDFLYSSADANSTFGADPANEANYDIAVRNNLWGFQLGGRLDWFATPRFSLYAAPKFGIYANYMEQRSRISNGDGIAAVGPGNPLAGGLYDIASDETITSFIGEFDVGMSYQLTRCWSASLGYRAIAVSGLAYATDQIPGNLADLPGVAMIDSNADMVLHGGYAAVTLTW